MRHLTHEFALGALRRGRQIEQFLGGIESDGLEGLRYVTLAGDGEYVLCLHEVEDVGTVDFVDVSEFPSLDRAEYVGEGREWGRYSAPEDALSAAAALGAQAGRWVNQGVLGDEYVDFRQFRSSSKE